MARANPLCHQRRGALPLTIALIERSGIEPRASRPLPHRLNSSLSAATALADARALSPRAPDGSNSGLDCCGLRCTAHGKASRQIEACCGAVVPNVQSRGEDGLKVRGCHVPCVTVPAVDKDVTSIESLGEGLPVANNTGKPNTCGGVLRPQILVRLEPVGLLDLGANDAVGCRTEAHERAANRPLEEHCGDNQTHRWIGCEQFADSSLDPGSSIGY